MGAANSSSSGTSGPIASLEDYSPPFLSGFFGRERSIGRGDAGPVDAAMLKQRRDVLDSSITDEEEDDMSSTVESSIMSMASSTETNEKAYRAHQRRLRLRHAASVVAANDGWLVIHRDESYAPGAVLGHTAVTAGEQADVVVELDEPLAEDTMVWAMLHMDDGAASNYCED